MTKKISEVGQRPWSRSLRCPNCRGTSFEPRRSLTGRAISTATLGLGTLVTPKSRVRCATCGSSFKRR
jgi:DNA-directed RNA polymerase subunit RPC12/RpoP